MLFYVVILKTDTPDKPLAAHLTKLKEKHRQKQIFKMFTQKFADYPKEYYVVPLEKKGKLRNFYTKKAALDMINNLSHEHGYYVKYRGNTWAPYVKPTLVRKQPKNKQYPVQPIPTEDLRHYVIESIDNYSPVDEAAKLIFERKIPVFSMKTRMFGMTTLFMNSGRMLTVLMNENMAKIDGLRRDQLQMAMRNGDKYLVPGKYPAPPGLSALQGRTDRLFDWIESSNWYKKKKIVHEVCSRLTKLYQMTPGSRKHTVDAVEMDLKKEAVVMVI